MRKTYKPAKSGNSCLKLTEEDRLIANGPRHPFFKGLYTEEAREFMSLNHDQRKEAESQLLIRSGVQPKENELETENPKQNVKGKKKGR